MGPSVRPATVSAVASRGRWLVLCYPNDPSALWAVAGLTRRGLVPIDVVSPEALVCSQTLVHTINEGRSRTTFNLPDGSLIDSTRIRGVLNRVTRLPTSHLHGAAREDASYAQQELHAIVLSVVHGLESVINAPTPQGLAGRCRTSVEWLWLAGRAGLRTIDHIEGDLRASAQPAAPWGTDRTVIVFDGRPFGPPMREDVAAAAARLATLSETRLLGVDLVEASEGDWWFTGASAAPDLRVGGEALLDALATALGGTSS